MELKQGCHIEQSKTIILASFYRGTIRSINQKNIEMKKVCQRLNIQLNKNYRFTIVWRASRGETTSG